MMPDYNTEDVAKTVRLIRPDLVKDTDDPERSYLRLVINAYRFYPGLVKRADMPRLQKTFAGNVIRGQHDGVLTVLPYELWSMREDLQDLYDLTDDVDREAYIWWFFQCGVAEYNLTEFLSPVHDSFVFGCEEFCDVVDDDLVKLPRLARYIWTQREDLQRTFDLNITDGVRGLVSWFYQFALSDERLRMVLAPGRQQCLLEKVIVDGCDVPRLAYLLWQGGKSLKTRFPAVSEESFIKWWEKEAVSEVPLLGFLVEQQVKRGDLGWPYRVVAADERMAGVNLVGYAEGESGVAEDVRAAAKAMQAGGIPFSVVNLDPGSAVSRSKNAELEAYYDLSLPYNTTLFCTTGIEMLTLAAKHGESLFSGSKVIGYWPWELSTWPESWQHAFNFVDEVWSSSRFTYHAMLQCSLVPVRLAPMVVSVCSTSGQGRRDFGLRQGMFYFVYTFDFLSTASRKNPLAVLRAFKQAFSKGDLSVGLVIKSMRASHSSGVWDAVVSEANSDPRIVLLGDTLDRGALLDLYRACDCFVSLHRSEGFGRGIAECMLLGKPVIVTAYSGNLDFTGQGNAALVDYNLKVLQSDEYPQGDHQVWAEPQLEEAVWWMRRIANDRGLAQSLAANGLQSIVAGYSPEAVARRYMQLLDFRSDSHVINGWG